MINLCYEVLMVLHASESVKSDGGGIRKDGIRHIVLI